ncbi:MAG: hypothetical protein P4M15_14200 [Alphaproteobacteria bacterium]|nr:hypothetical protein [Alphaproteobacteria bacterium]
MKELMQDPMFVYGVAFAICMLLAFKFGRKPILAWLDGEIAKIRVELDQAAQLRAEAEAALAASRAHQEQAEKDVKEIVKLAEQQVEDMRRQAEADLTASLAHQQRMASERIHLAEAEAVADVRAAAIELALQIARKNIAENLSSADAARIVDETIAAIPALKKSA